MIWKFERDISPLRGFDMTKSCLIFMTNKGPVISNDPDVFSRERRNLKGTFKEQFHMCNFRINNLATNTQMKQRYLTPSGFDMTVNELLITTNKDFANATNKDPVISTNGERRNLCF